MRGKYLTLDAYFSWQEVRVFAGRRACLNNISFQVNGITCANERRCNIIKIFQDRSATALQRMGSAAAPRQRGRRVDGSIRYCVVFLATISAMDIRPHKWSALVKAFRFSLAISL